MQIGEKPKIRF